MAEEEKKVETSPSRDGGEDDFGAKDDHFKAPEKVDLSTLMARDAEDQALARYKASLLGQAASAAAFDPESRRTWTKDPF